MRAEEIVNSGGGSRSLAGVPSMSLPCDIIRVLCERRRFKLDKIVTIGKL